jgi:hypothetical protein
MGEGVGMNAPATSFKLLRLQILAYLNPPPLIQEEEFGPPKSLIYTLSLLDKLIFVHIFLFNSVMLYV